jgi:hypothetical protein
MIYLYHKSDFGTRGSCQIEYEMLKVTKGENVHTEIFHRPEEKKGSSGYLQAQIRTTYLQRNGGLAFE